MLTASSYVAVFLIILVVKAFSLTDYPKKILGIILS